MFIQWVSDNLLYLEIEVKFTILYEIAAIKFLEEEYIEDNFVSNYWVTNAHMDANNISCPIENASC